MLGKKHLVALVILSLSISCKTSQPPSIDICIGDGYGGADCALKIDSPLREKCAKQENGGFYCPPSALVNVWMTTQSDMEAFSSWCYDASRSDVSSLTQAMKARIKSQ